MGLTSYLTILLFSFPPVFLLVRYLKKDGEHKAGKSEVAGILTCTAAMVASLIFMMVERLFY